MAAGSVVENTMEKVDNSMQETVEVMDDQQNTETAEKDFQELEEEENSSEEVVERNDEDFEEEQIAVDFKDDFETDFQEEFQNPAEREFVDNDELGEPLNDDDISIMM